MDMTYDRLNASELTGETQTDYLVALDAYLRLVDGDKCIYEEPGYPVVELARSLVNWLAETDRGDFEFDSMSFEEVGSITIRKVGAEWEFGSVFAPDADSSRIAWCDVRECCQRFVARVSADLAALGIDPSEVIMR